MVSVSCKPIGKVFDPNNAELPLGCEAFAQSPQTLVFDDKVRVYFSSRVKQPNGMYKSHIVYADMTLDLKRVLGMSTDCVVPLGELGCFDEHGIFPINVLRHENKIYAYTCGWSRRVAVSVETGIGFAESSDGGKTFKKLGPGPILSSSLNEPFLVGDAFVKVYGGRFHMWYMFGTHWKTYDGESQPERTYKIGHAISEDGISWQKDDGQQVIPDKLGVDESMALPTVISHGDKYHMFFCYRESSDFRSNARRGYRIGYAYSSDLVTWERADERFDLESVLSDWDSDMQCYPHVFEANEKVYLLYNGNAFGRFGFGAVELTFND